MILNNTQANIFKVNGGIADNFANRPAASGSFYIFYSIDTQEIYYDNGTWILLGSGGGGVNIYNSDGTLTGNRTLSGANNDLNFANLNVFVTSIGGNDIGLNIDFATQTYQLGDFNAINNGNFIRVIDQLSIIDLTTGIIPGQEINFLINSTNQYIKTRYQGNDIGLKLDFANNGYFLGYNWQGNPGDFSNISIQGKNIYLQNYDDANGYLLTYEQDSVNAIVKTTFNNNDIGLKLDFANSVYQFGQITGGNTTYLEILDTAKQINTLHNGIYKGFSLDFNLDLYKFGQHSSISNNTFFEINDNSKVINAYFNNGINGLQLDFTNQIYFLGQLNSGNKTKLIISDSGREIYTSINNSANGLLISQSNDVYKFGVINGGNVTNITITDGAVYPIRLNGNNLSSGTSGGSSGQHLKININGTNYKIALLNP